MDRYIVFVCHSVFGMQAKMNEKVADGYVFSSVSVTKPHNWQPNNPVGVGCEYLVVMEHYATANPPTQHIERRLDIPDWTPMEERLKEREKKDATSRSKTTRP